MTVAVTTLVSANSVALHDKRSHNVKGHPQCYTKWSVYREDLHANFLNRVLKIGYTRFIRQYGAVRYDLVLLLKLRAIYFDLLIITLLIITALYTDIKTFVK